MNTILILFVIAFSVRLLSLFKSVSNEKALKQQNAKEFGRTNSTFLSLAHIVYYLSCALEAVLLKREYNYFTYIGIGLFTFSMIMLWLVIRSLKDIWTVKLIIADKHCLNTNWMFRNIKHPNYFLNIVPELMGIALLCQAWHVLAIGFPIYLMPLTIRIIQENRVMKTTFPGY